MKFILSSACILFMLLSCSADDSALNSPNCNLSFMETKTYAQDNFSYQFDIVMEESRCPEVMTCFWSGVAKINLKITKDNNTTNLELSTLTSIDGSYQESQEFENYVFTLIQLYPYPESTNDIAHEDYCLELDIREL